MSEYDHLITTICSSTASVDARSSAERRLLELLSMPSNLTQCLPSLYTANDTIVFFLGIGLQRLIWKYWTHMDQSQHDSLLQTLKETLLNRADLQTFSKAKLEQVLAAICVASSSLQPVFSIICQVDNPGFLTGLSAVKTVLENVLGDDPKVDSISRESFVAESGPILAPLTNLACTACLSAMQQSQSESSLRSMKIGLDLLKVIVSKLQIGPHITLDVLMLLFSIAEAYPDPSSPFHELAFSAVEILTEVMYKRYIPTGSTSSSSSSSGGSKSDQGVKVLMHLVAKTIDLLKRYRENLRSLEDSQMVMSLLEFIAVFGENHMERCMNAAFSHVHITSMDEDVARLQETTMTFFNELVVLTTSSMDPRLLLKTVQVWRRLVTITHVKESILSQQSVCVTIVSHLLSACLIQSNPHLQENMDEILESLHADVYVDMHSKEIMQKVSPLLPHGQGSTNTAGNSNRAQISSAEEHNYVGCALQEEVHELLPEFLDSKFACQWLHATLPTLLTNNMTVVLSEPCPSLSYTRASLDLRVLIRMVPLIATNLDPILQLLTFVVQVVERHVDRGTLHKECILLLMTGTQIVGQFFLGHRFAREIEATVKSVHGYGATGVGQVTEETAGSDHPSPQEWAQHMETTFGALSRVLQALFSGAYTSLRVSMELQSLLTSLVILYTQSVQALVPLLDLDMFKRWRDMVDENLSMFLSPGNAMQIQTQCPIVYEDIAALFLCAKEAIQPGGMSAMLVPQLGEATHMLESVAQQLQQQQQQPQPSAQQSSSTSSSSTSRVLPLLHPQTLNAVYHVVASLDVLTRNHHSMKVTKRQVIATTLTPMGALLPRFIHSLLYLQQMVWMEFFRLKQASLHATSNRSRSTSSQDATLVITLGSNGGGLTNGIVNGGVGNGDASAEIALVMEKLTKITKLAIASTTALLQRVGKKTFGKVSGDVFELCVAFTETCTTPTPTSPEFVTSSIILQPNYLPQSIQAIYALNPQNILALALFDAGSNGTSSCQGLKVLLEIFELSQLVAQSTAATSANVATQIQCTHRLLVAILPYLSDDRVCAELLPMTLKTGIAAVNNYWQKAPRTSGGLPFLPSIAAQSAHGGGSGFAPPHPLLQSSPSLPRHPLSETNGVVDASGHGLNVKALTGVFVTLCIGSLGDSVPPSDTLIALEGLLSLKEQHDVFNVSWFQEELWEGLFGRVVRCLLLRIHAMHGGELEALFTWLVDTRVQYLRAVSAGGVGVVGGGTSVNRTSPHSMLYPSANSPSLLSNGASAGSPVVGNEGVARTQEFWFQLGNQMVTLASEVDCGDLVHEYLSPVIATFIATSTGSGNGGDVSADTLRHLGQEVVQRMVRPVVALIFRRI